MIRVYDSLRAEKVPLIPLDPRKILMYVCGPTVYDYAHIGHARTEVSFDVIRKYLEYRGYFVVYVSNITDIDDKIINRARNEGKSFSEISSYFADEYIKDMRRLKVKEPNIRPRVSDHISEIIDLIQILIERGYAYEADGNVYFEVKKFRDYGKLSHQKLDEIIVGARVEVGEGKRNPEDFALWKKAKEGEPFWESPWGKGRPGWHIECSAMSMRYLGETFDIHGGGSDLIFPHHENEIAQSESASGREFARYWLHTGLLRFKEEKMSKSIGNVIFVRDILNYYRPEVVRFFIINTHYRKPVDYSVDKLEEARESLERLVRLRDYLYDKSEEKGSGGEINVDKYREAFIENMDDDFNTRNAVTILYQLADEVYDRGPRGFNARACLDFLEEIDRIFDIFPEKTISQTSLLESLLALIIDVRSELRKRKMYEISDRIRNQLNSLGIILEDSNDKTSWRFRT